MNTQVESDLRLAALIQIAKLSHDEARALTHVWRDLPEGARVQLAQIPARSLMQTVWRLSTSL